MDNINSTEFEILKLLWKNEELSSREIHEEIKESTHWAFSTTRTVIERMVKKGQLAKDNYHGVYIYKPNVSKVHSIAKQISLFAKKVLERDSLSMVPLFVKSNVLTKKELEELKDVLESLESEDD